MRILALILVLVVPVAGEQKVKRLLFVHVENREDPGWEGGAGQPEACFPPEIPEQRAPEAQRDHPWEWMYPLERLAFEQMKEYQP